MSLPVFILGWGTAYKCSLYKSAQEQAHTPVVKIDTRGSDVAKAEVETSVEPDFPLHDLLPVVAAEPRNQPSFALVEEHETFSKRLFRHTPALFLRPPPRSIFPNA
ncbi:hypothetical protein [Terriglobus sp.]|uniref:hypothetical protein n=1 Tax=Terriglobus sp. TaxID=1889013 RepID=UPI003B008F59